MYKRNHNFCFRIFVFTIFSTILKSTPDYFKINVNNVIDWRFADCSFFGDLSFFFPFKGARLESSKVRLSSSILRRKSEANSL